MFDITSFLLGLQKGKSNNVTLLEDVPITLDFSNSDQQNVSAPEGYAVKTAIIAKPEMLKSENIVQGVTIAGIKGSFVGGATETDIIPLQDAPFTQNTQGIYEWYLTPAPTALKAGETYHVKWGEDEYTLTAVDASAILSGGVALGNLGIYGMADTGEPFLFAYVPNYGGTGVATLGCLTLATDATHTIRVYQDATSGDIGLSKPWKMTWGTFDPADVGTGMLTIPHKLGVVPDMVSIQYTYCPPFDSWQNGSIIGGTMFSRAVQNKLEEDMTCTDKDASTNSLSSIGTYYVYTKNTGLFGGVITSFIDEPTVNGAMGLIQNANASTFQVGGGLTGKFLTPFRYRWVAVSGLI